MPVQFPGIRGAGYQTQTSECHTHRLKTSDISRGARWLHRCPLQSRAPGSPVAPALWLILATLLFFLAPSHLYASRLCQLLGAVKSQWVLGVVIWNPVTSPTLPLPARGSLSWWGAGSACGMGWHRKMKLLFLYFCVVILLCVCVCVCFFFFGGGRRGACSVHCSTALLKLLKQTVELSQAVYCSCIANYWSFGRDVGWGLPPCHLGDSSP